jgi:hypothetical protein
MGGRERFWFIGELGILLLLLLLCLCLYLSFVVVLRFEFTLFECFGMFGRTTGSGSPLAKLHLVDAAV